jgi:DNA-binding response OmpR family regulator
MAAMRVLIIEDNRDIVANLYAYLEPLGYLLDCAYQGEAGLAAAAQGRFDAIVLDLTLPGLDGVSLCRRLRQQLRLTTPVLMLTARDTIQDKVLGFESGADDYLVKPFSLAELDVRLKALLRRSRDGHAGSRLQVGDLWFDRSTMQVQRSGQRIELTPSGYKLLARLMSAAPALVGREELAYELWGDAPPDSDALRTHIHALRQAIDKPFDTPLLKTLPGQGYRLEDVAAAGPGNAR